VASTQAAGLRACRNATAAACTLLASSIVHRASCIVQADYEAAAGKRALLAQRVETEILDVSIRSERHRPFWTPIGRALREFGGHLAEGISTAITGLAYLVPWLVLMSVLGWAGRRWWRRRRGGKISAG